MNVSCLRRMLPARFYIFGVVAFSISITGCQSSRGISPTSQPDAHASGNAQRYSSSDLIADGLIGGVATPPPPFRVGVDHWKADSTPGLNRDLPIRGKKGIPPSEGASSASTTARRPQAILQQDDYGGQAGTTVNATYQYGSMQANQTVWQNFAPRSGDILYAPTMKAPGNDCLEASTIYGYGSPTVGWWDFCIANNSVFHNSKTVNSTFISTYVRDLGDGVPMYTIAESVDPNNPAAWHGLLYNYTTSSWEDVYDDSGTGAINGGQGWSMFETHFHNVGETCYSVPTMMSDRIMLNGALVASPATSFFSWGDCFNNPYTGPYPYVLGQLAANYHWQVTEAGAPCGFDYKGYCAVLTSSSMTSQICYIDNGSGAPIKGHQSVGTKTYEVYSTSADVGKYTDTIQDAGAGDCSVVATWSPQEPSVQYNDPNLP